MSRHHSHLTSANHFLQTVVKQEPLAFQLKRFFAANKKYGSKDRKIISTLCYNFYRLSHALLNKTNEEKIIASTFLCSTKPTDFLATVAPVLNEKVTESIIDKCSFVAVNYIDIFKNIHQVSNTINLQKFALSFLSQPNFFIRLRQNKMETVVGKLAAATIDFTIIDTQCIALPQATKIDTLLHLNSEVVVQDYSSQQVFNYLKKYDFQSTNQPIAIWDCCAASGGKSILIHDVLQTKIALTVSDVRASILNNLKQRFKEAGIKNYQSFVADLTIENNVSIPKNNYDIIICDAPCTGSGTWSRTPEQLAFFDAETINVFTQKQKAIASNALPFLQKNGLFIYITCSVFTNENEAVVDYLKQKFHLQLLQMEYIKGYESQADTMFVAVLQA